MVPIKYTNEELHEILVRSDIDLDTGIKECKEYMALHGWTIRRWMSVDNGVGILVYHNNVLKKENINGFEVRIMKDDKIIGALMDNERDALLVCVIQAIRDA